MDTPFLAIVLAAVHLAEGPDAVPLGAASVASALKAAFPGRVSVSLIEALLSDGPGALAARIKAAAVPKTVTSAAAPGTVTPAAVGFSLYSWNRAVMVEAAGILRAEYPDLFLFCGGPEASALPGGLARSQGGPFDAVIRGEGESAAAEILGRRFFGAPPGTAAPDPALAALQPADRTSPGAATGLTGLPSPWLDGTLNAKGRTGALWELARGCPYSCAYCYESKGFAESKGLAESNGGGRRVRYFPEGRIREELKLFIRDQVPYVFVLDPTFNSNNKRALDILNMIIEETEQSSGPGKRRYAAHWHFEVRGELLTREQARLFAALGASLQIGLQTADPKVSALIGRSLNRGLFASRIGLLNDEGTIFGLDLIYGLPGDSLWGYCRSLDFALSLYPNSLDMFRLAVLPGTALFDKAAGYGLGSDREAPYLVRSAPEFPQGDLDKAEALSQSADLFYNQGRAVAWFNQALRPLRIKPSAFLEGFGGFAGDAAGKGIEEAQLAWLEQKYRKAKKEPVLPALRDLVRFHGAWGRTLAEGAATDIAFTYHPDEVLGEQALDLEAFAASAQHQSVKVRVQPGKNGPRVEWGKR